MKPEAFREQRSLVAGLGYLNPILWKTISKQDANRVHGLE